MIYPISILYKYLSNFHNSRLYCPSSPRIRATPRKISKIHTLKSLIYAPINVSIASLYMSSSLSLNVSKLCHAYVRFMSCICTNHEQRNGRKKNKWNGFIPCRSIPLQTQAACPSRSSTDSQTMRPACTSYDNNKSDPVCRKPPLPAIMPSI